MTSNQIAYGSYQEDRRHNDVTETETNRHNVATEKLEQESLGIQRDRLAAETVYNTEKNRIQEEYNRAYLEYQNAIGQRKLDIESRLADLTQQRDANQNNYNMRMADINTVANDIRERQYIEDARHNKILEGIENEKVSNQKWYQDKDIEYKNHMYNENLSFHSLTLAEQKLQNQRAQEQFWAQWGLEKDKAASGILLEAAKLREARSKREQEAGIKLFSIAGDMLETAGKYGRLAP